MKKAFTLVALVAVAFGAIAQDQPTEQQLREFRNQVQKRDISNRHLTDGIPLAAEAPHALKGTTKGLPEDRVWFPGEWEEVKAIVVTPYYNYVPTYNPSAGTWMAEPLVTGHAQYYRYTTTGWREQGSGPYKAVMDTSSSFSNVSFYLMDAIQLGGAEAWVRVEAARDSAIVLRKLKRMGLRSDNVKFLVGPGNSFWYRDCGPICFYYGDEDNVAMLDFGYYPGRALDDSLPTIINQQMGIPNYFTPIEWEGGNCLVDGVGMVLSSDAIYSNNADSYGQLTWDGKDPSTINYSHATSLSRAQVKQALHDLLGQRATYILPAYRYDGGTGHIDLYADMWDENGFVFSIMPDDYSSWTDYVTGSKNIDSLTSYRSFFGREYTMESIPFPGDNNGNNFASQSAYNQQYTRTYSNHTFVNNVIMQPCFSQVVGGEPTAAWDKANIEQLKAAYPGYTIYPVDVREFDGSGGAIHCITKQIPADNPIRILHKNIRGNVDAMKGRKMPISAVITNRSGIAQAIVNYRVDGGSWQTQLLTANGNRFYGELDLTASSTITDTMRVEYYIIAVSNNAKTITKPMTANQGGYFSFYYTPSGQASESIDSVRFDFDTLPVAKEEITFTFSTEWTSEDHAPAVALDEVEAEEAFGQFYPNPAATEAHIQIDLGNGGNYDVQIVDASGRTVHRSELHAAGNILYTIQASRLQSGLYMVVFSGQGHQVVRKLVVSE